MNLVFVEMIFGSESKHCLCGIEVRHQQPKKRAGDEDIEDGERLELFEAVTTGADLRSQVKGTFCHAMCVTDKEAYAAFRMETQTMHLRALPPELCRPYARSSMYAKQSVEREPSVGLDYTTALKGFRQFETSSSVC